MGSTAGIYLTLQSRYEEASWNWSASFWTEQCTRRTHIFIYIMNICYIFIYTSNSYIQIKKFYGYKLVRAAKRFELKRRSK